MASEATRGHDHTRVLATFAEEHPEDTGADAQKPGVVERLYRYSQHGDRMYGGTDKMLRFFQYGLACIGCQLRERGGPGAQFAGRQCMAVKHEVDRGRVVSRFFGVLDEVRFLSTQEKGGYLGAKDLLLKILEVGQHTSLIGYYLLETCWWFLQTCPEVDRRLGGGGAWVRRWDGESSWSFRFERWFNWPLVAASCIDFVWCCRRWSLLRRAHDSGRVSAEVARVERREIVMDFLGYVCGEMFLNLFALRNPNVALRLGSWSFTFTDFAIYFGSLLAPLFNEHGLIRVRTDRSRAAVYAREQAKAAAREQTGDERAASPVAG